MLRVSADRLTPSYIKEFSQLFSRKFPSFSHLKLENYCLLYLKIHINVLTRPQYQCFSIPRRSGCHVYEPPGSSVASSSISSPSSDTSLRSSQNQANTRSATRSDPTLGDCAIPLASSRYPSCLIHHGRYHHRSLALSQTSLGSVIVNASIRHRSHQPEQSSSVVQADPDQLPSSPPQIHRPLCRRPVLTPQAPAESPSPCPSASCRFYP